MSVFKAGKEKLTIQKLIDLAEGRCQIILTKEVVNAVVKSSAVLQKLLKMVT